MSKPIQHLLNLKKKKSLCRRTLLEILANDNVSPTNNKKLCNIYEYNRSLTK
jgi:hypothetical protein